MRDDVELAFPHPGGSEDATVQVSHLGLTIRDYFAAQALAGLISQVTGEASSMEQVGELVANAAYALADAMLKEREK